MNTINFRRHHLWVTNSAYIDNIESGEQNVESPLKLQDKLIHLFKVAGMKLYKWILNSKILLNNVPHED